MVECYEPKLEKNINKNVRTSYTQTHAHRHHCCYFYKGLKKKDNVNFAPFLPRKMYKEV